MSELGLTSATRLLAALRAERVTSRDLLETYLERIAQRNAPLGAVITLDAERARGAADAADVARKRGEDIGPLHGLPMTVKDSFETTALRTACGFPPLADHIPHRDADAVARLKAAGAIVFGKTNTPLLAGDVQSYNALFGTTNNPWDLARTSGGSSGGAAVAVAMGFTAIELGSDIGGSIRTPSNWCGVYGHKSSHGIISGRGHIPGMPGTLQGYDLEAYGPIARSADDLALALGVLAGPPADRAVAWTLTLPPPRRDRLQGYRIAAWFDDPACPVDEASRSVLEDAVAALRRAGCQVDEARPQLEFGAIFDTYFKLLMPVLMSGYPEDEFARFLEMASILPLSDETFVARSVRYGTARHRDWLRADEVRAQARAVLAEFFGQYDALLLPTTPVPAILHDHSDPLPMRAITVNGTSAPYGNLFGWIALATMSWHPATVAPVGQTTTGLPVGIQIVGPYLEDYTSIDIARRMADITGGFTAPPGA